MESQEQFFNELKEKRESVCPCCTRPARISRLKIHSTLAYMLCKLYGDSMGHSGHPHQYRHLSSFKYRNASGNDFSIAKHWELVETIDAKTHDKRSSGLYRLTPLGAEFVAGTITIPKYVYVFNNRVLYIEGETSIKECLGDKFSYYGSFVNVKET